jgi:hypothetical protein
VRDEDADVVGMTSDQGGALTAATAGEDVDRSAPSLRSRVRYPRLVRRRLCSRIVLRAAVHAARVGDDCAVGGVAGQRHETAGTIGRTMSSAEARWSAPFPNIAQR